MNLKCQIYIESIMMILLSIEKINGGSHKVQLSAPQNETFLVYFNPPVINNLKVNSRQSVYFNCSPLEPGSGSQENSTSYAFVIISDNDNIARPVVDSLYDKSVDMEQEERYAVMSVEADREHNFTIEAMHVGRVTMSVAMLNTYHNSMDVPEAHYVQAISVSVKREQRLADIVFNSSAAAVAILISFGIGCVTDTESLKRQLKYPVSLVIGFCCQFILMPVVAFGLAMLLPVNKDIRFGLLCVACVPGGGLGHVAVMIGDADAPLSLTMNMISVVAMLGTAPLWVFVLGQYFQQGVDEKTTRNIPIYDFEIWLASTFFAYTFGLVINRFRPVIADAILTWLIKPLLLLATILYITLGVYINMYVFEYIDNYAVLGAILLPVCGCATGFVFSVACRQKVRFIKTIALETSSMNCLIVLAALRFSLPQPDADMASMIPIWVMFTMPGLYVCLAILQTVKKWVDNFLESRKQKNCRNYSIVSGIINQPGIAALSAPLFVAENSEDEHNTPNEKVTVL
ncbi:ileal sodium/bile acid cotransporter-like [Haliotis cracherodii]|uniref:ileal sodium/bile acid cotransporter-like n=1 Tax=Haliotis cracherodii TaxID=6455 RepID=UPI001EB073EE